ncbi:hypothetical protein SAMN02982931_02816 [Bauldia litoralis]|uniref:Uncharacterized protein n=1 Tax=Bauldia litoralis TaxID=665467 RepID=A0A1G6CVV3_9HYPH|nr:hypothetical protein SAMN02982931_02816 [Bauldia litoralis]
MNSLPLSTRMVFGYPIRPQTRSSVWTTSSPRRVRTLGDENGRLKKIVADLTLGREMLQCHPPKALRPARKCKLVDGMLADWGVSIRRAFTCCRDVRALPGISALLASRRNVDPSCLMEVSGVSAYGFARHRRSRYRPAAPAAVLGYADHARLVDRVTRRRAVAQHAGDPNPHARIEPGPQEERPVVHRQPLDRLQRHAGPGPWRGVAGGDLPGIGKAGSGRGPPSGRQPPPRVPPRQDSGRWSRQSRRPRVR